MPESWASVIAFLSKAVVISLSGVLAPGPMTAAAVAAGARRRHAGVLMALGHGIVELPLMVVIMVGMGTIFQYAGVKVAIGLVGGMVLLLMGAGMLKDLKKAGGGSAAPPRRSPLWAGAVLSGGNPYFLIWWATVGLALATQASELGALAFGLFAVIHWSCDLVWLEVLSVASFKGSTLMGGRVQVLVLGVCGTALLVFGGMFLYEAAAKLLGGGAP